MRVADAAVGQGDIVLSTLGLGSCIAIALYDRLAHVAGLAHILLPNESLARDRENRAKFAQTAVPLLLEKMRAIGARDANVVAKLAGAQELPLKPCRRHLFVSPPIAWVDSHWPFVWDVTHDIYFRPEGEGLLLCACDQSVMAPGDPPVDESVKEMLAEKIERFMPALNGVSISRGWAGLRTLTPDGRFVIGWDPQVDNFFWVAGLGGHGMTTSAAVGELAAKLLMAGQTDEAEPFRPGRFQ